MGNQIIQSAALTAEAVPLLRRMNSNANRLLALTSEIAQIEEDLDHVHDDGLKRLLTTKGRKDPMAFIIGSEIYTHLEKVADRFEDVASTMSGIVIEHM